MDLKHISRKELIYVRVSWTITGKNQKQNCGLRNEVSKKTTKT